MTVAALATSGMAASTSPAVMSQKVSQPRPGRASGRRAPACVMNGRNPQ